MHQQKVLQIGNWPLDFFSVINYKLSDVVGKEKNKTGKIRLNLISLYQ